MNKTLLATAIALAYSAVPVWANPSNTTNGGVTVSSPAGTTESTPGGSADFKQVAIAKSTQGGAQSPQANEGSQANNNTVNDNDTKTTTITKTDTDTKNVSVTKSGNFDNTGVAKAKDQAAAANNGGSATTNNSDQENDKRAGNNLGDNGRVKAEDYGTAANNGNATSNFTNAFNTNKAIAKIDLEGKVTGNKVHDIGNNAYNTGDRKSVV